MKTAKFPFPFLTLLMAMLLSICAEATPTLEAQVDRTTMQAGDTLTLTLRLNDTGDETPDYGALKKDFDVLGVNSSSGIEASIGHMQRWTEWQISLSPLRSGTLTIPSFAIGTAKSQPIRIQVQAANTRNSGAGSEPIFVEASVDHDTVYVQQQILFTVRVYTALALDQMNITEPEFDNATVRKLAQHSFQKNVNGTDYQVHELNYVIFPQQSGDLTIPELVFTGSEGQRIRSMFDFPRPGRTVRKLSKQIDVHVKPVPAQFSGKTWLPARNLTLQETWGGNPQNIAVGNSITRAIAMQADGAMAAQLPALDAAQITPQQTDKAKIYADQPTMDDQADGDGMHGKRVESAALIPSQAGTLQLPEVRVHWWDLDSDSEKVATIPAQTLAIGAGTATTVTPSNPADLSTSNHSSAPTFSDKAEGMTSVPASTIDTATDQRWWYAITATLLLGWLSTLWLYWRLRNVVGRSPVNVGITKHTADTSAPYLQAAIAASQQHQASAAHAALSQWVRHQFPQRPTLAQWLQQLRGDSDMAVLREAIEALDRCNYSAKASDSEWSGTVLAQELMQLRNGSAEKTMSTSNLPLLYPAH